jgi:organic radical activating enzyme
MGAPPIVTILLPIAKRVGQLLDLLPFDGGVKLRRTRVVRAMNGWLNRDTNDEPPAEAASETIAKQSFDPAGSAPLCVLPWVHTQIETSGNVQLCCVAHNPQGSLGSVHTNSILQIFQSDRMNAIRDQMQNGTWPADCAACRDRESSGLVSFRQSSNLEHPALFDKLVRRESPAPRIRSLDLRINNVCNFKCRFCDGLASNRWFNEHNLVFPDKPISEKYHGIDRLQSFWDDFDREIIHDLEVIHLAGGEPLIIDAHYRLLEKLIAAGKSGVALKYDTNLSRLKFKHWDVMDLWKQFPNLQVSASLDGVGRKGEYIRDGLDYGKWVENARRLQREVPHAHRAIHFVVCIFNVIDFPEHVKAIVENGFAEPGWITFTFLNSPAYLSVQVLTPALKAEAERKIRQLLSSDLEILPHSRAQIEALIEFMNAEDLYGIHGREFAEKTRVLDHARGQSAAELFPDLAPMLETGSTPLVVVNR